MEVEWSYALSGEKSYPHWHNVIGQNPYRAWVCRKIVLFRYWHIVIRIIWKCGKKAVTLGRGGRVMRSDEQKIDLDMSEIIRIFVYLINLFNN